MLESMPPHHAQLSASQVSERTDAFRAEVFGVELVAVAPLVA